MQTAVYTPPQRAAAPARMDFVKATVFGLLMLAAAGVLLLVAALVAGDAGFAVFGAILAAVPSVLALIVPRSRGWALIVTAVLMLPALLFIGPAVPDSIGHPNSFFDFVPAIAGTIGTLIALISAIAAFVQHRRGGVVIAPAGQRTLGMAVAGALAALALVSAVATVVGRSTVSAAAKAGATALTMKGSAFKTRQVSTRAGEPVRLLVKNDSPALHNFTIKQLGVAETLSPGSEKLVQLLNVAPGSYTYVCTLHDGMTGTLTITQ